MDLNLIYDSSVASAPAGFQTALTAAADYLDRIILNPITVNIAVGWGEYDGMPLQSQTESLGGIAPVYSLGYQQVREGLSTVAGQAPAATAYANLPPADPSGGAGFLVSSALQKAWGMLPANGSAIDGYVGFGSATGYNFTTTGDMSAGGIYFMGVAEHELTHALGRFSDLGGGYLSTLDLFRYSAPGVLQGDATDPFAPAYFSIDGGRTPLAAYATSGDNSDWATSVSNDAFDAMSPWGTVNAMSPTDLAEMAAIGFEVGCFAAGTRLRTPRGEIRVEALRAGRDSVLTAAGRVAAIRWIGARTISVARHPSPERVMPVRVARGALGPGQPVRDLVLSPDHAVFLDGVLIPVRLLVNGRSIARVPVARVRYLHVELSCHDVILAEGLPVETYLDTGNRAAVTGAGHGRRGGEAVARRLWARRGCAPLVESGPGLIAARRRVLTRAVSLGHLLTEDAALEVLADTEPVPARERGGRWEATLPPGVRRLRLRSRWYVPAEVIPEATDPRRLGVAVARLWIDGRDAALDGPVLREGWHAPERHWRWTAGDAVIDVGGARHLAFRTAITGRYWAEAGAG